MTASCSKADIDDAKTMYPSNGSRTVYQDYLIMFVFAEQANMRLNKRYKIVNSLLLVVVQPK